MRFYSLSSLIICNCFFNLQLLPNFSLSSLVNLLVPHQFAINHFPTVTTNPKFHRSMFFNLRFLTSLSPPKLRLQINLTS
ncbi:hypothetical protein NC652_005180 [Populus alba x Populus x berolinensis]|nr:hypothetical protein NC652_005180 [Populus alba x Populus x berolinensis]